MNDETCGFSTAELLAYLCSIDVQITDDHGRLACAAPKGVLTPALQRELRARKTEILELLRQNGASQNCIHECFEAQASRTPDAIAVVCGPERLTYRQ